MCGITLQCVTVLRVACLNMWGACVHCNAGTWYWFCVVQKLPYVGVFGSVCCQGLCGGEVERFYGCWLLVRVWKIAFWNVVWGLFRWLFTANSVWMWNLSIVFEWAPFLWQCTICMILFMGPNEWDSSIRCFAKLELLLLWWKAVLCALYRMENRLAVCPT